MQTLTRWADIAVFFCVIGEFILAEQTRFDRGTALRARHVGHHPRLLAGLDVLDLKITLVGYDVDRLDTESLLRRLRGLRQQANVDHLVGDLLLHDQLVLGIDCDLNVVAHSNMRVGGHRPAIGIGQRDLVFPGPLQLFQHSRASRAPLADRGDLLSQVRDLCN
jgi:hypothetical protein